MHSLLDPRGLRRAELADALLILTDGGSRLLIRDVAAWAPKRCLPQAVSNCYVLAWERR